MPPVAAAPDAADEDQHLPRVWLLLDDRPGHRTQVIGLAEKLGWRYEIKELAFTPLNRISNRILGASLLAVDKGTAGALTAPWPDLVIAMGRRSAPVARWIKRQSGGRTLLVQLGRKGANAPADFDLAVTCRHFQFPDHPNRQQILLPPTQVTVAALDAARQRWPEVLANAGQPRVVLLVGGTTAHHRLTPQAAREMAVAVQNFADHAGGSLTCVTSRRTGSAAEQAIVEAVPGAEVHGWRAERTANPYLGYLAQADILVVTGDSESMLAEAAATAKPLFIYPIEPQPTSWRTRLSGAVLALSQSRRDVLGRWCTALIQNGWVVPPRNLDILHHGMVDIGRAAFFAAADGIMAAGRPEDPTEDALVRRVRALLPTAAEQRR